MASDGTDQLEFILFDKKAEHLFRKPVDKLIDSCNKGNIPHEIQALVGQKSTFIIKNFTPEECWKPQQLILSLFYCKSNPR